MNIHQRNRGEKNDKETTVIETFNKALSSGSEWQDKDEFLDVIYWLRQIVGVVLGLIWGVLQIKGIVGLALFLALNVIITYIYLSSYQRVDEEEFGGLTEILKEGLMTSFSSFLVAWIIVYSALHFE